MADLDLRADRRDHLAAWLCAEVEALIPGSAASLRGSLAARTADPYSDIDLCWVVDDERFSAAVSAAARLASRLPAVWAVRMDPGLARSDRRRLVFLRLTGVPLFWRADLDIRARSVAADDSYDDASPAARDTTGWSPAASAIENAVAAIKSGVRGQPEVTSGLLSRGYQRIGLSQPADIALAEQIARLAQACAGLEPGLTSMATEIQEVADTLLAPPPSASAPAASRSPAAYGLSGIVPVDCGLEQAGEGCVELSPP